MADRAKPRAFREQSAEIEETTAEFSCFAREDEQDRRAMRYALCVAVVLHGVLLVLRFPELRAQISEPEKPIIQVSNPVRFHLPPPEKQAEIPKARKPKVPIPDPTPDEPEPIRFEEEIDREVDLPMDAVLFRIPEAPPPTEPSGPIHLGGDMTPPRKIHAPQPQYTEIARRARIEGVVIVQAIIDKQGDVTSVKLLKGLPMGLDQAALEAMREWRFEPARLADGRPVVVYYTLTVNFELH